MYTYALREAFVPFLVAGVPVARISDPIAAAAIDSSSLTSTASSPLAPVSVVSQRGRFGGKEPSSKLKRPLRFFELGSDTVRDC
jgi:hypothetical protein